MHEDSDEQLSLANDCTAQWYGARLITRHALVQSLVGQERVSVRHEFVFGSKGKNETLIRFCRGGRVGKSRYRGNFVSRYTLRLDKKLR